MLKKIAFAFWFMFLFANVYAQEFSNVPYQSLVSINPSFAGSNGLIRNQTFVETPVDPQLNYFSFNTAFDAYITPLKSGVAASLNHYEQAFNYKNTAASISFVKYFTLKEHLKIIPSVQLGYAVKQIASGYNAASIFVQPGTNAAWVRAEYFSLNGGVLINYKNFYGGVSVFNTNRPDVGIYSEERIDPLYNIHASYNIHVSDKLLFNLYGQISSQNEYSEQFISLNMLILKHLIYGIGYRWHDMALMSVGCRTNYFSMQVAYNKNISRLKPEQINYDYWQLIMSFNLRNKEQRNTLISNFEAW